MVIATLGRAGTSPRSAAANLRRPAEHFRRIAHRQSWTLLGAKHLTRSAQGGWWWHHHLLVVASGSTHQALVAAVRAAGAWADENPVRDCLDVLAYALRGAITPTLDGADLAQWIIGTARVRLVFSSRARDTDKRTISPVTHTVTPATQTRARVVALLSGSPPMAASALRRRLTPGHRGHLDAILATMAASGELLQVAGRRGSRWALAREAA